MASEENVNFLMEMGFSKERAEKAATETSGLDLQAALDWLISHPEVSKESSSASLETATDTPMDVEENKPKDDAESLATAEPGPASQENQTPAQALSLVCEECGKQLRSEMDAQAHAARSGHQKFAESSAEIKPLSEEEKKKQVEELQKKMAERRKEREEMEKEEAKKRERIRRKTGKEITEAKQKLEIAEAKKIAEERRREKQEERLLRQRLKQKIAQDRANMKAAQGGSAAAVKTEAAPIKVETKVQETKEYENCRIQLRFPNGSTSTANFKPDDVLSKVYEHAATNGYEGQSPLALMTTFPRKTFSSADMQVTLKELGLVPSSVVIVTKT